MILNILESLLFGLWIMILHTLESLLMLIGLRIMILNTLESLLFDWLMDYLGQHLARYLFSCWSGKLVWLVDVLVSRCFVRTGS